MIDKHNFLFLVNNKHYREKKRKEVSYLDSSSIHLPFDGYSFCWSSESPALESDS